LAAQLLNTSTALLDPVGIMPSLTLGPFTPILPTAVVTDQMGEKWDINAPDDVNVSVGSDPSGLPHITFHFNYSPTSLFNSAAHGIETVHISPEVNNIGDATGFKAIVDFDVTNALPVTMGGFLTYLVDNEVATGPLDKGAVHPTNYSHVHNVPANAFAPEKLDLATPDFLPAAPGVAVSNLSATGVLNPGQTVRSDGMTMHQVELAGHDNGFTLNFFPFGDPSPSKPVINGLPASEVAPPHGNPFASVTVTDASILPIEVGTITINDVNGNPTDANGTLSNGVTKTGVGTYSVANAFPTDFTKTLDGIAFDPTANASGSFTLKVDNGDQNTTATESFTSQPGGGGGNPPMLVTTDGPTLSLNGHSWSLQNEQVMVDGVADATSLRVVALEVDQGRIYQENADKQWWSKAQPGDTWQQGAPPDGSADPPLHVSPDNTVVTDERHTIIDGGNNTWSIVGGQVSVNGQIDMNSARVIELAYENGAVWQENADQLWWAKHSPSDTWAPDDGTPNSPVIDNGVTANFVVANSGKPPPMGFLQPNSNDPTVVAPASAQPPTLGGSLQAAALASPANLPSVPGVSASFNDLPLPSMGLTAGMVDNNPLMLLHAA